MTTDNFCFYLQNRLIQTSQTGGQQYNDTSPFSIPWCNKPCFETVYLAKNVKNAQGKSSQLQNSAQSGHTGQEPTINSS